MSRQELYAWSSLGFTAAIFAYYLITVFGWPAGMEAYAEQITDLIWKVIGITVLAELILDLLNSTRLGGIHKDERDIQIAAKGFRNAYYFLMGSIIVLVVHVIINDFIREISGEHLFLSVPFIIFHVLVFILFIANIIRSGTQVFYYQWNS